MTFGMKFNTIFFQYIKPKPIDYKPRRTKAKGKGGTAKIIKTKKILKDLHRRVNICSHISN